MIEPFYFGASGKRLFGIYHPPRVQRSQQAGVVLCYPMGHEYYRSHRFYVGLANLVASAGLHALRFDFFGCGDSEGESCDATIYEWIENIHTAVEELAGGCSLAKTYLIGSRLGASLACIYSERLGGIDGIVQLDPIINGTNYLADLARLHARWQISMYGKLLSQNKGEALGFPLTKALISEIESIDLMTSEKQPVDRVFLIESDSATLRKAYKEHIQRIIPSLTYKHITARDLWVMELDRRTSLSLQDLSSVVEWLCEEDA